MKNKIVIGYSTNRDVTSQQIFNKEIKKTIGCEHEIFVYENDGTISLTEAYNKIWNSYSNTEDIIFCFIHHDIHFKNNGWGKTLLRHFNNNDVDIIGVAGTNHLYNHGVWWLNKSNEFNKHNLWGKVWHTDGKKEWKSDFTTIDRRCAKLQPVVAIDGVFITFNPDTCEQFDEHFDGFHFYDISFSVKNFLANKKIMVTETIPICHESGGQLNSQWEMNRQKLIQKYNLPLRCDL